VLNTGAGLVRVADEIARLLVQTGLIGLRSEQLIRPLPMSLAGISSLLPQPIPCLTPVSNVSFSHIMPSLNRLFIKVRLLRIRPTVSA